MCANLTVVSTVNIIIKPAANVCHSTKRKCDCLVVEPPIQGVPGQRLGWRRTKVVQFLFNMERQRQTGRRVYATRVGDARRNNYQHQTHARTDESRALQPKTLKSNTKITTQENPPIKHGCTSQTKVHTSAVQGTIKIQRQALTAAQPNTHRKSPLRIPHASTTAPTRQQNNKTNCKALITPHTPKAQRTSPCAGGLPINSPFPPPGTPNSACTSRPTRANNLPRER